MIKDFKSYFTTVGNRLSKAFSMEEFGTEQELEFWSLSAEHMSRKKNPGFVDIVQWMDLLYRAPVHFVYKKEGDKLLLERRHILTENILGEESSEKMPHEQTQQEKEFIQSFEHQVQNIEKKMNWSDEFLEQGISSHAIGNCEHIPLYDKEGEMWGIYCAGPYTKSPEQIEPKLSIVGRILSSWLIALEESELGPQKEYQAKIKEVVYDLGTGTLNTEALAHLIIKYVVNSLNALSGGILESMGDKQKLLASVNADDKLTQHFSEGTGKSLFDMKGEQTVLTEEGEAFFKGSESELEAISFKGEHKTGVLFYIKGTQPASYDISSIMNEISRSIGLLLDYREENITYSNKLMDNYYTMLRAIERSRDKTLYHTPRMIAFAQRFGMLFGLEEDEMSIIELTAKLHDIGYVGATGIEPGKSIGGELTHPVIGANMIEQLPVPKDVVNGIKTHHEWVNGQGSPAGITADHISWTGKIIGLFEFVVDFIETNKDNTSKSEEEWIEQLSKELMQRADVRFDMVLVPTAIQLIQSLGWEQCCRLGEEE